MARPPKIYFPKAGALEFELNDTPYGAPAPSRFNAVPEYYYLVNAKQNSFYAEPAMQKAIVASGAQAGDRIRLTRVFEGDAAGYRAEVLSDAKEPAPVLKNENTPAAPPKPGSGWPAPETAPARPATEALKGALVSALDAVLHAEAYAREKGRPLTFSEESVRAIALSVYISGERGNR